MSDNETGKHIRQAFDAMHEKAPPFDELWTAAESQHRRERRRYAAFGSIAAAVAVVVITFMSTKDGEVNDEYLIADSLLNDTHWTAPSDVLLPQHSIDIYREVPFQLEPTNFDEGSLLCNTESRT